MEWRLVDPRRDRNRVREFLTSADPNDYLLDELDSWVQDGRLWAGDDAGHWVAFGRLHDLGNSEGWVSGVRVDPARRQQGVGRALIEHLKADARHIGVSHLRAVIEDPNTASRRLFARCGFEAVLPLTLRCAPARHSSTPLTLHLAGADAVVEEPVGWVPGLSGFVDLLPGSDGGRFGLWNPALPSKWQREGKLYVGPGLAVAVQLDWWRDPRTLWVNPLRGDPKTLLPQLDRLAWELRHEEWQGFLPSTDPLRAQYEALGTRPHPYWGDRVQLYQWTVPAPPTVNP